MQDNGQLTDSLAACDDHVEKGNTKSPLPQVISFDLEQHGESLSGEQGSRRNKEFWLTAIFAIVFFIVGCISLVVSLDWFLVGHQGWMQFFMIGFFLVIPGGYASYHILGILLNLPGFNYESVSNWES